MFSAQVWAQPDKGAAAQSATSVRAAAPAEKAAAGDATSGLAAVYNTRLNGRQTARGERYNKSAMTAGHITLRMGTLLRVPGVKNKRNTVVRINDRGPAQAKRVLDVSSAAARMLGMKRPELMQVTRDVVGQPKARPAKKQLAHPDVTSVPGRFRSHRRAPRSIRLSGSSRHRR